ncbi:MAG: acetyl-CoA carboxylase carboxyl transferase subunit alpha, partial [Planctomycetota bacterium]|nr:acetyl-CoA carboxylase carboxyl transferase subunit alpha [Planctomycetota bacterium]
MAKRQKRVKTLQFMLDEKYEFDRPIEELDIQILELEEYLLQTELEMKPLRERLEQLRKEKARLCEEIYSKLTPWQKVLVARHPLRPTAMDYVEAIFEDFLELHGDKKFGDDKALICGFARISDGEKKFKVMLVAHEKGRILTERMERHFGCAHPEGYRKALDKMRLAEKFGLPIICLIDTPGAYPGIGAEERGQAFAIAQNIMEMSQIKTPIIAAVIGEGGSGGALGIGVGDKILMLEYSYYSV